MDGSAKRITGCTRPHNTSLRLPCKASERTQLAMMPRGTRCGNIVTERGHEWKLFTWRPRLTGVLPHGVCSYHEISEPTSRNLQTSLFRTEMIIEAPIDPDHSKLSLGAQTLPCAETMTVAAKERCDHAL
ncbi:hypothetical protein ALC53_09291 [Atta colombica]|uniref:Uncharacterized protein n=1 Tax=Atta colombica TaxID=520822 RepID=A0A195B7H6_9HYME|nr:hypothetical protein ALC53_09291 [Atta colombica]